MPEPELLQCPKCFHRFTSDPAHVMQVCPECRNSFVPSGEAHTFRDPLLVEREKTHGAFNINALIAQQLKEVFHGSGHRTRPTTDTHYYDMHVAHREALDMIALKLSRILSGQADFKDHWDDIAGYAKLASEACNGKNN